MFISVFDVFKVGVGPSSSHTIGPMIAAGRYLERLSAAPLPPAAHALGCRLHGSLAYTGEGHGTIPAVVCGLLGLTPLTYDHAKAAAALGRLEAERILVLPAGRRLAFSAHSVTLDKGRPLPGHPNGLTFFVTDVEGRELDAQSYYSVGGGFVLSAEELGQERGDKVAVAVPYPFDTAADLLDMNRTTGLDIAALMRANEAALGTIDLDERLMLIWQVMDRCMTRGLAAEGILPGGLKVKRRAKNLRDGLISAPDTNERSFQRTGDWILTYAMAVNEENAAGGQVVTAPTNGAAGVIPAVIRYYLDFVPGAELGHVPDMLLTAAAIGALIKANASISGAEVGCQGEVGSASAMAAAALCAALGGSTPQVENAAEIALEHHLGMTCDPIRGLVQIPCIERNGMGAIKAVAAASLAMRGNGQHIVSLDNAIETMRQTGRDMDVRYKETSLGGLSVNVPEC